jgi:CubicO group peptidase (beta-lactamase class C family)
VTVLTLPDRWRSFTLDDGRGAMVGVELTANPMARWGWSVMGRGWSAAGSGQTAQEALDGALAEIQAHETLVVPVAEPVTEWGSAP